MNADIRPGQKSRLLMWRQSGENLSLELPLECTCYQNSEQVLSVCVMLHGFGDDCQNFIGLANELAIPGMLCVALDAPLSLGHLGLANGKAWFDLFSNPWQAIEAAQSAITLSVAKILEKTRLPASKLVFLGFSQGGLMSLLSGLSWPSSAARSSVDSLPLASIPGAVVSLSGFLMGAHRLPKPDAATKNIRIFIGHGNQDQVVFPLWYFETVDLLKVAGYEKVETRIYNAAHTIDPQEMRDLKNFLKGAI